MMATVEDTFYSVDDAETAVDGVRETAAVPNFRPDHPLPDSTAINVLHNRRTFSPPANDNRPGRYHLQEWANREELGINEAENRRHWFAAERFKRDLAISKGEPLADSASSDWRALRDDYLGEFVSSLESDAEMRLNDDLEFEDPDVPSECAVVDNGEGEPAAFEKLYAQQVITLARDVLGREDFATLEHAIERNWTPQTLGENELYMNRASASAFGKGLLRAALRNLARFYDRLDRLELSGERPLDTWPLIGTQFPTVRIPREHRTPSYLNQSRNYVIKVA